MHILLQVMWLAAPIIVTGVLHMVVVKNRWLPSLAVPLDGGRSFRGERIFGDNKTWRGVVVMVTLGAAAGALQGALLGGYCVSLSSLQDVALLSPTPLGYALQYAVVQTLMGVGYVLGELPNSFLKRRLSIAPGKTGSSVIGKMFFFVDQADSVVVGLLMGAAVFPFGWRLTLAAIAVLTGVHLLLNALLFVVGVRKNL
jgi:CDP-archaeol synthase